MERTTDSIDRRPGAGRAVVRGLAGALLVALTAAACSDAGRTEYEVDGDTGAAAPATTLDQNTAKMQGADSTPGVGGRTGVPAMAGDSSSRQPTPPGTPPPR